MDRRQELEFLVQGAWGRIQNLLVNADVLTDEGILNCFKWTRVLCSLSEHAPRSIRLVDNISSDSQFASTKLVVMLSTWITPERLDQIQAILSMSPFQECYVFTSINHDSHLHYLQQQNYLTDASWLAESQGFINAYFTRLEGSFYETMQRSAMHFSFIPSEDFVSLVRHEPLLLSLLTSDVFLMPSALGVWPSIHQSIDSSIVSAVPMKLVEKVTGISSSIESSKSESDVKLLSASLNSFLEALGHKDEIFVLGETSKQLAKFIVAQAGSANRRNSETNLAVVLVDRTLDLQMSSCHPDNLLDRLYHIFEESHKSIDLCIPSQLLFSNSKFMSLSLAHGMDQEAMELLQVLCNLDYRNAMVVIRKRILDILSSELSEIHLPKVLGRVTKAQLESLLSHLKDKWPLIQKKGAILQIIIAAVESLDEMYSSKYDTLNELERVMKTASPEESVQHIHSILSKVGMQYSLEDVVLLCVYASSLGFPIESMKHDFLETLIRLEWKPQKARAWITSSFQVFERIRELSHSRRFNDSLCFNLAQIIGNPAPLAADGLVHVPYTGTVGSMISGLNRFLGTTTVHPSHYKHIFIFIVGGITFSEIKDLQRGFKASESEVMIGSNQILSPSRVYQHLFGQV